MLSHRKTEPGTWDRAFQPERRMRVADTFAIWVDRIVAHGRGTVHQYAFGEGWGRLRLCVRAVCIDVYICVRTRARARASG